MNEREYSILIASLIYSFDRSANTVGHYESYIKNGMRQNKFKFELIRPLINGDKPNVKIYRCDANELAKKIKADVFYIDPPYSSRQYSRFYHLIETVAKWDCPKVYGVALKPNSENMSEYCRSKAVGVFKNLIMSLKCKYIYVSYNNMYDTRSKSSENKITLDDMRKILCQKGTLSEKSIKHKIFNAGRTEKRDHKEILFIIKVRR